MKKSIRIFWIVFLSGFGAFILLILLTLMGVFGKLPSIAELENPTILQSSEVYAADGTLMGKYYSEKGNRSVVGFRDISKHVIDALVATEDQRFYDHSGIDFKRTITAIALLGRKGGGSTISQQLALNLFNERSSNPIRRSIDKLKEYIIAIRLERNFTKEEILALYLNAVPFGDNVYGIRNAARTFFQKEPDRLDVVEAATLVGMLRGNYLYNPRVHEKAAFDRKNVVIGQMEKNGYLTTAEADKYRAMPIPLKYKKADENTGLAPYFREEVLKDEVRNALKGMTKPNSSEPYDIYKDGLKIYTTINPKMQQYAEEAVAQQMPMLQKAMNSQPNIKKGTIWKEHQNVLDAAMKSSDRWKNLKDDDLPDDAIKKTFYQKVKMRVFAWNAKRWTDTVMTPLDSIKYHRQMMQSAFMVMNPIDGSVMAWVGGIDFKTYKLDHAQLGTKRQVGSSIKPLLYSLAIQDFGFTPTTPVEDVQQSFGKGQLVPATARSCKGNTITMASALAWSKNCATAYIMKQVGPARFASFLEQVNIPTKVDPYPSIALGSCDLSLFEMMWGYSMFPGHGYSTKPCFITKIEDRNGNIIKQFQLGEGRKAVISEATAYQMCKMMEGPVTVGTAAGLKDRLGAKEMGGKTGTTNDNADFWFMGYTPQLLAGTWVGCDDRFIQIESAAYMGGTAARPIWEAFFKKVYADKNLNVSRDASFEVPADMGNESSSSSSPWYAEPDSMIDEGNGTNPDDYSVDTTHNNIPAESQLPVEEDQQPKRDNKPPKKDSTRAPKIGDMAPPPEDKKEKKGLFKKLFGKKEKNEDKSNDYR